MAPEVLDRYVKLYEQSPNLTPEEFNELIECEKKVVSHVTACLNELVKKEAALTAEIEYMKNILYKISNNARHWREVVEKSLIS